MLIEADMKGNFVGSSYGWANTRDWAKFGLLYLNQGNWNGEQLFDSGALALLAKSSRGIPRLINMLCHKSLMCAYGKGARQVEKNHVIAAINDTEDASMPGFLFRWWGRLS